MTRGQLCVGWTTVLGTVAGIALLIIGGIHVANAPDATDDFRTLASPCVVVGVYYMGTTTVSRHNHASKKTDTYCYDQYTYEFAWCQDNTACAPSAAPSSLGNTAPRAGYAPSWSSTATEVTVYRDWWSSFPPPATFATSNTGWESSLLVSGVDMVMRGFGACSTQQQQNSTHDAGDWVTCYQPNGLPVDAAYRCGNPSCIKVPRLPALLHPRPPEIRRVCTPSLVHT